MQRGEVWWVEFDERRLVVLLSGDDASGIRVMQVVAYLLALPSRCCMPSGGRPGPLGEQPEHQLLRSRRG